MINNRFEVLSNLNGCTDYNLIEIERKFYPTTTSRVYSLYIKGKHQRQNITIRKYLLINIVVIFGDRMLVQLES